MTTEPAPVTISIVGTEGQAGGGVAPTVNGTIAETPNGQPDLRINVIAPGIAILVRAANLFLTTFVGLLTAAGLGGDKILPAHDLAGLLSACAWTSLIVAGIGTLKNLVTVFGRLEGKYPLSTGSI